MLYYLLLFNIVCVCKYVNILEKEMNSLLGMKLYTCQDVYFVIQISQTTHVLLLLWLDFSIAKEK